jgi:hypothetical protein
VTSTDKNLYSMPMPTSMGKHESEDLKNILKLQRIERQRDTDAKGNKLTEDEMLYVEGVSIASNGVDFLDKLMGTKYTKEEVGEFIEVIKSLEPELHKLAAKMKLPDSVIRGLSPEARKAYSQHEKATMPMMSLLGIICLNMAFEQLDGDESIVVGPEAGFTIADRALIISTFVRTWAIKSVVGVLHQIGETSENSAKNASLACLVRGVDFGALQQAANLHNGLDTDDASGSDSSTVSVPM